MRLTAACLLLCVLAPLSAQDDAAVRGSALERQLTQIYLDDSLRTGDLDAYSEKLAKLIETEASLPALRAWGAIEDEVSNPRPVYKALSVLAKDNFKACGIEADAFAETWVKLARRFSNDLAWQQVAREWGGVTDAAFVGPFADGTASAYDDVFSPEVMLDFGAEYDGIYGRIRWESVRHYQPLNT